jgi:hypothetical protein
MLAIERVGEAEDRGEALHRRSVFATQTG